MDDAAEKEDASYPRGVKLGVDVGLARVGLAVCDPSGILATPVRTLRRDAKKDSDIAIVVAEVLERSAVEVFIGLPRTLKGAETASAQMARGYAQKVADALAARAVDVPVRLVDERLTTVSARQALHAAGVDSRNHRKVVDQAAAVAILQHAIDMEKARQASVGDLVPGRKLGAVGDAETSAGKSARKEEAAIRTPQGTPVCSPTRTQDATSAPPNPDVPNSGGTTP